MKANGMRDGLSGNMLALSWCNLVSRCFFSLGLHILQLNQQTLREYTMARYNVDRGLGPSPYLMNQLPSPPQSARTRSPRKNRRTVTATDAMGRPVRPKSNKVRCSESDDKSQ